LKHVSSFGIALLVIAAGIAFMAWQFLKAKRLPDGFASGNGRMGDAVDVFTIVSS
jgi:hypothetical protein